MAKCFTLFHPAPKRCNRKKARKIKAFRHLVTLLHLLHLYMCLYREKTNRPILLKHIYSLYSLCFSVKQVKRCNRSPQSLTTQRFAPLHLDRKKGKQRETNGQQRGTKEGNTLKLRDYQTDLIDAARETFRHGSKINANCRSMRGRQNRTGSLYGIGTPKTRWASPIFSASQGTARAGRQHI